MVRSFRRGRGRSYQFAKSESLEMRTLLSTSALDPNFGTAGEVTAALGGVNPVSAQAVLGDASGKIVVAAEDGRFATILRYAASGKVDSSFGSAGKEMIDFGAGHLAESLSLSLQADGKILVGGNVFTSSNSSNEAFIARLKTDGTPDSTFGTGGKMLFHFGSDDGHYVIAALSSGKIVVATDGVGTFIARRLNSNGTTDSTFGTAGTGTVHVTTNSTISGIAIQSSGKIVLGGTLHNAGTSIQLARFNSNGTPDASFGSGGAAVGKDNAVTDNAIAVQADGRIIAAGRKGSSSFYLERFNTNGTVDATFGGSDGMNTTFAGSTSGQINAIAIESSGKIVAAGTVDGVLTVATYQTNGKLDTGFGTNGMVTTKFGANTTDSGNALAVQSSGRIVVAGSVTSTTTHVQSVGIARYLGDHVVLTAGQSAVTTGTTSVADPRLLGTVVASQTLSFSSGTLKGQVQEWVEQETASGTLDFYFRIVDTSGPASGIASLIASNFAGYTTYVDYRPDSTGTIAPVSASRSSDNKSVTFSFLPAPNGNGDVTPGTQSYALFIKTNAIDYSASGKVLLNGSIALAGYQPAVPTEGKLDTAFGDLGFAGNDSWTPGIESLGQVGTLVTQSDGKIIAGSALGFVANIARFNADGDSLDKSFGTNGFIRDNGYTLTGMGFQSSGDLIVAGDSSTTDGIIVLHRYTTSGKLDSTFGTGGTTQTSPATGRYEPTSVKVLANNQILVAGNFLFPDNQTTCPFVIRYTSAGKIDTTFGKSGIAILNTFLRADIRGIAVQSNGGIILGGSIFIGGHNFISAFRLTSGGMLDTSFGNGGIASSTTVNTTGFTVAVEVDNSILLGGSGDFTQGIVMHLSAGGMFDANFGGGTGVFGSSQYIRALTVESDGTFLALQGGAVEYVSSGGQSFGEQPKVGGNAVALQAGGKYVLGGDLGLGRITPQAVLDQTFGRYGLVQNEPAGGAGAPSAVVVQKDGKIIVAGTDFNADAFVNRYNADGSLDTAFGFGGEVLFPGRINIDGMVVDSSGRILLAGAFDPAEPDAAGLVERLNANGSIDKTFAVNGLFTSQPGSLTEFRSIALQGDGKIVVGGQTFTGDVGSFVLERILSSTGKLDTSFGTGGATKSSFSGFHDSINSLAIQTDGKIVVGGSLGDSDNGSSFIVARYTAAGKLDTAFGTGGKTSFNLGGPDYEQAVVHQVAIDSQGRIVAGGSDDYFSQGLVFRLTSAGKFDNTFADKGIYDMPNVDSGTAVNCIAILPGDKILMGGYTGILVVGDDEASIHPDLGGVEPTLTLAQVNSNGTPDLDFGQGGLLVAGVTTESEFGFGNNDALVLALQSDSKILVGEQSTAAGVVRLTGP